MGQGVVELLHEEDHAFAAGYSSVRAWRDRMKVLIDAGFIKATTTGNRKFAKVLLVHPERAMKRLWESGKIQDDLWQAYRNRAIEVGQRSPRDEAAAPSQAN